MPEQETNGEITAPSGARATRSEAATVGWARAGLAGIGVFVYFVVAATWLPSALLRLDAVASSSQWVRDAIATSWWLATLGIGLFGLRWIQAKGWI